MRCAMTGMEGGKGSKGKPLDESILTAVPRSLASGKSLVEELPFDPSGCRACPRAEVCRNAAANLPFVVRSLHQPRMEHRCAKGEPVVMCRVVPRKSSHLEGEQEEQSAPQPVKQRPLYVLDANILLNAFNGHPDMGEACWWVLTTSRVRICTTPQALAEAYDRKGHELPAQLLVEDVGLIEDRIMSLRPAEFSKEPSEADRSLMQAVLNNPEIRGIITFDKDLKNIAAPGLLSTWTGRKIEVMNAFELRARHGP